MLKNTDEKLRSWPDRYVQLRQFVEEADDIARQPAISTPLRDRLEFLNQKIAAMRAFGEWRSSTRRRLNGPLTIEERALLQYLNRGEIDKETRDLLEGTQSVLSWSVGSGGGYLVPQDLYGELIAGMAQVDPLLEEDNVCLIFEIGKDPTFNFEQARPMRIVGWDLSTITSQQVSENAQSTPFTPTFSQRTLNGFTQRCAVIASFELEQDSAFEGLSALFRTAFAVAFARGMGNLALTGTGSGEPQGLLTVAVDTGYTTAAAGALSLTDFESIYFKVDRIYRSSPKCVWLINDATYQVARKAVDNNNRPLLSIREDEEQIMGKKVLVSPSMPSANGSKGIVFGDLSNFIVRISSMSIRRAIEAQYGAEYGQALYTGMIRLDSMLMDPTGGTTPPIVFATLHS